MTKQYKTHFSMSAQVPAPQALKSWGATQCYNFSMDTANLMMATSTESFSKQLSGWQSTGVAEQNLGACLKYSSRACVCVVCVCGVCGVCVCVCVCVRAALSLEKSAKCSTQHPAPSLQTVDEHLPPTALPSPPPLSPFVRLRASDICVPS